MRNWGGRQYWGRVGAIALGLAIVLAVSGRGEASSGASSLPLIEQLLSPSSVSSELRIANTTRVAQYTVHLDGYNLFAIAAPESREPSPPLNETNSLAVRAEIIEQRLAQIAISDFDPKTLRVTSVIDKTSRQPVLSVSYTEGEQPQTLQLLTVTSLDAQLHAASPEEWAQELAQIVESGLIRAHQERQPPFLKQQLAVLLGVLVTIALSSLIVNIVQQRLRRERRSLSEAAATQAADVAAAAQEPGTPGTTVLLQHQLDNRQQRRINEIERRLLQVGQILLWGGGLFFVLGLFPFSRWLQGMILYWLQVPLKIVGVILVAYLLIRISEVLVDRFFWILQDSASLAPELSQRVALRFSTFSRVVKSVMTLLLFGSAVMVALSFVGVQVGPLLAGAGIIGLAVSFASQSVIKDMINGFLILLEDQYGVGDVIVVGEVAGLVENMNLRITQLRNEEGRLITIPNSAITIVQNLSKEWSRVDLTINVAYHTNIDQALAVIDRVAQEMSRDRHWRALILEPPQLLGIDRLDHVGVTVRLWIKTQPLKQWEVAREYRRRLKNAFDDANIDIGVPQQALLVNEDFEGELHGRSHHPQTPLTGHPTAGEPGKVG